MNKGYFSTLYIAIDSLNRWCLDSETNPPLFGVTAVTGGFSLSIAVDDGK